MRSPQAKAQARATRPVFVPEESGTSLVSTQVLRFDWHSGLALSQARRSISALHEAARDAGFWPVLEISSKAPTSAGVELSAFNLMIELPNGVRTSVESAYQASKVFDSAGGPWPGVFAMSSWEAKAFARRHEAERLVRFEFFGKTWPLSPPTAFYDWIYISALCQRRGVRSELTGYKGFSDIAFNPGRSLACQARSAAVFAALVLRGQEEKCCSSPDWLRQRLSNPEKTDDGQQVPPQMSLF